MFTEQLTARLTSAEELENAIPVLALDLDSLKCVETKAVNFSDWGCKLVGEGLGVLNKNIALKLEEEDEFQRGKVTGHKSDYVTVLFQREVTPSMEKRGEPRYPVTVAARIRDLARKIEISCMITDASRSGCRVEGANLSQLPDDLLVYVEGFERPVRGQVAWKEDLTAGLRLNWEGASALAGSGPRRKPVASGF